LHKGSSEFFPAEVFARIRGVPGRKWLYVFTAIATVIGVQLLYLTNDDFNLNAGLSVAVIIGFVFSYYLNAAYQRFMIVVLDIVAISIFIFYITKVASNPVTWGNELGILLGLLISIYSFRAYTERDHRMILASCLVIMLLASVASYDVKLMFVLPLFVFCGFASLYVANNLSLSDRIPYLASEVGAGSAIVYLAGRATIAVLVVSILFYMLVPHSATVRNPRFRLPTSTIITGDDEEDIPLEEREQITEQSSISGFSDEFDLKGGRIELEDEPVLLVRSTLNDYLRGKVFDVYNGKGWSQSELSKEKNRPVFSEDVLGTLKKKFPESSIMGNVQVLPLVDFPSRKLEEKFLKDKLIFVAKDNTYSTQGMDDNPDLKYSIHPLEITFLKNDVAIFFSPYQPYRIEDVTGRNPSTSTERYADPVVDSFSVINAYRSGRRMSYFPKGIHYKFFVLKPSIIPIKLKEAPNNYPAGLLEHYTQLPPTIDRNNPNDALARFAITVANGGTEDAGLIPYEKVLNIYDHFVNSGEYEYSLEYPELPTKKIMRVDPESGETYEEEVAKVDAAYHFVFVTKKGYCEFFANAFAVFCRINSIPSRIVTGFAPGRYDFMKNGYVVSTRNAHSWVEVYFDGFGWVSFDPTPASSDFLSASEIRSFFSQTFDYIQNLFVIDPQGVQRVTVRFFATLSRRVYEVAVENSVTSTLILAVLSGFLIFSIWRRRPRREPPHIPKNAVVASYYGLESALAENGYMRPEHMTGKAFLRGVASSVNELSSVLNEIANTYYVYAYSLKEPDARDAERARAILTVVREYFAKREKRDGRS